MKNYLYQSFLTLLLLSAWATMSQAQDYDLNGVQVVIVDTTQTDAAVNLNAGWYEQTVGGLYLDGGGKIPEITFDTGGNSTMAFATTSTQAGGPPNPAFTNPPGSSFHVLYDPNVNDVTATKILGDFNTEVATRMTASTELYFQDWWEWNDKIMGPGVVADNDYATGIFVYFEPAADDTYRFHAGYTTPGNWSDDRASFYLDVGSDGTGQQGGVSGINGAINTGWGNSFAERTYTLSAGETYPVFFGHQQGGGGDNAAWWMRNGAADPKVGIDINDTTFGTWKVPLYASTDVTAGTLTVNRSTTLFPSTTGTLTVTNWNYVGGASDSIVNLLTSNSATVTNTTLNSNAIGNHGIANSAPVDLGTVTVIGTGATTAFHKYGLGSLQMVTTDADLAKMELTLAGGATNIDGTTADALLPALSLGGASLATDGGVTVPGDLRIFNDATSMAPDAIMGGNVTFDSNNDTLEVGVGSALEVAGNVSDGDGNLLLTDAAGVNNSSVVGTIAVDTITANGVGTAGSPAAFSGPTGFARGGFTTGPMSMTDSHLTMGVTGGAQTATDLQMTRSTLVVGGNLSVTSVDADTNSALGTSGAGSISFANKLTMYENTLEVTEVSACGAPEVSGADIGDNAVSKTIGIHGGTIQLYSTPIMPIGDGMGTLNYHLDAATLTDDGLVNGSPVATWTPRTATGSPFEFTTRAGSPTYVTGLTHGTSDPFSAVRFPDNTRMQTDNGATNGTVLFVVKRTGNDNMGGLWGSSSPGDRGIRVMTGGDIRGSTSSDGGNTADFPNYEKEVYVDGTRTGAMGTDWVLVAVNRGTGNTQHQYYNNYNLGYYWNDTRCFRGDYAEVFLFDTVFNLSGAGINSDFDALASYLAWKYDITTSGYTGYTPPPEYDTSKVSLVANYCVSDPISQVDLSRIPSQFGPAGVMTFENITIVDAGGGNGGELRFDNATNNDPFLGEINVTGAVDVQTNGTYWLYGSDLRTPVLTGAGSIQNGHATPANLSTITVTGSSTFDGIISDGGAAKVALVKDGAGETFTLTGANTYTGGTTVGLGTLVAGNASALGDTTALPLVMDGGTLDVYGNSFTFGQLIDGGGTPGGTIYSTSGNATVNVGFGGVGDFANSVNFEDNGTNILAMSKIGASVMTLAGASTFTGGLTLSDNGGIVLLAGDADATLGGDYNALVLNDTSYIDVTDHVAKVGRITGVGTVTTNAAAGGTIEIGHTSAPAAIPYDGTSMFNGLFTDGGGGEPLTLVKQGSGTITLGDGATVRANTHTGGTQILGGTLVVSTDVVLAQPGSAAGQGTLINGGTLQLNLGGKIYADADLALANGDLTVKTATGSGLQIAVASPANPVLAPLQIGGNNEFRIDPSQIIVDLGAYAVDPLIGTQFAVMQQINPASNGIIYDTNQAGGELAGDEWTDGQVYIDGTINAPGMLVLKYYYDDANNRLVGEFSDPDIVRVQTPFADPSLDGQVATLDCTIGIETTVPPIGTFLPSTTAKIYVNNGGTVTFNDTNGMTNNKLYELAYRNDWVHSATPGVININAGVISNFNIFAPITTTPTAANRVALNGGTVELLVNNSILNIGDENGAAPSTLIEEITNNGIFTLTGYNAIVVANNYNTMTVSGASALNITNNSINGSLTIDAQVVGDVTNSLGTALFDVNAQVVGSIINNALANATLAADVVGSVVNTGTLVVDGNSSAVAFINTGTLDVNANITGIVTNNQTMTLAGNVSGGLFTNAGNLTIDGNSAADITNNAAASIIMLADNAGTITNAGNFTLNSGTLAHLIHNSGTATLNGGVVTLLENNVATLQLPGGSTTSFGTIDTKTNTFDVNGNDVSAAALLGTGVVTNNAAGTNTTLTLNPTAASVTFPGSIDDGAGTIGLTKTGANTLRLTNGNTYSGSTLVQGGALSLEGTSNSALFDVAAGSSLDFTAAGTLTNVAAPEITFDFKSTSSFNGLGLATINNAAVRLQGDYAYTQTHLNYNSLQNKNVTIGDGAAASSLTIAGNVGSSNLATSTLTIANNSSLAATIYDVNRTDDGNPGVYPLVSNALSMAADGSDISVDVSQLSELAIGVEFNIYDGTWTENAAASTDWVVEVHPLYDVHYYWDHVNTRLYGDIINGYIPPTPADLVGITNPGASEVLLDRTNLAPDGTPTREIQEQVQILWATGASAEEIDKVVQQFTASMAAGTLALQKNASQNMMRQIEMVINNPWDIYRYQQMRRFEGYRGQNSYLTDPSWRSHSNRRDSRAWYQAFGSVESQPVHQNFAGFDSGCYGFATGFDRAFWYGRLNLGVAYGYGDNWFKSQQWTTPLGTTNVPARIDTRAHTLLSYGLLHLSDKWYTTFKVGGTLYDTEGTRHPTQNSTATYETNGATFITQAALCWQLLRRNNWSLTPQFRFGYFNYAQDAYEETISGGNIVVGEYRDEYAQFEVLTDLAYRQSRRVKWFSTLGYRNIVGAEGAVLDVISDGLSMPVVGVDGASGMFIFDFGGEFQIGKRLDIEAKYAFRAGNTGSALHGGSATIIWRL